jgi:hypothetical protein
VVVGTLMLIKADALLYALFFENVEPMDFDIFFINRLQTRLSGTTGHLQLAYKHI